MHVDGDPQVGPDFGDVHHEFYSEKNRKRAGQPGALQRMRNSDRYANIKLCWTKQPNWRKIVYIAIPVLILLALILGIALGVSLNKTKEDPNPSTDYVPTTINGSRSSLLQQGYWYTAPQNGTNFYWTSANPQLGAYSTNTQGVDIVINTAQQSQQIDGFGGALTDSSAFLLSRLKSRQLSLYNRVMDFMFNNATGVGITRVSMGASDFSVSSEYNYIPSPPDFNAAANSLNNPDSLLSSFTIQNTQKSQYTIPVLVDALQRNPNLKIVLSPWSPPAFMKSTDTMDGGVLRDGFIPVLAQYYAQTASAFRNAGVTPYALTLQNEPSHLAAYPSMGMTAQQQSQLAVALRAQLNTRALSSVQIWAHDDNYSGFQIAADIVNANASVIDAVAFHCYRGDPTQIGDFTQALNHGVAVPKIHMTECTGTSLSSRWSGIQGWLRNVYWPVSDQNARSIIQWNLALDSGYSPHLASSYCSTCSDSLTLSSRTNPQNPYVKYNDQMFLTAHFSSASTDLTNVGGGQAVMVNASTGRQPTLSSADLQCLNWNAYAAPLNAGSLQNPNNANNAQATRRIGLVVANTCPQSKSVVVSSDGRQTTLQVQTGLTTFVWTAP